MTPVEYEFQMQRLRDQFGFQAYSQERCKVLFAVIEECDARAFERQVTSWIGDMQRPPLGEQFREFAAKQIFSRAAEDKASRHSQQAPKCLDCSDRGHVLLEVKPELAEACMDRGYPVRCVAICTCATGIKHKNSYESSSDYQTKESAKSVLTSVHLQWYDIADKWRRPTFNGKSWEEFKAEKLIKLCEEKDLNKL